MKIKVNKPVDIEVKTLHMCLKVRDCFSAEFINENGVIVGSYEGYVPDFFPEDHWGDYVDLEIDIETGQIINWNVPTSENISKLLSNDN